MINFLAIGTPAKRLDTPPKVNGSAVYGIDVKVPGMKVATLAISPAFGGRLRSVGAGKAMAVRGVRQVVEVSATTTIRSDDVWHSPRPIGTCST